MFKKTLVALAIGVMSTSTMAQNVTVYGKMRQYIESYKSGTADALTRATNDGSRLGFKGTEYLGNGLSAFFTIETGVTSDSPSASSMGDRQSILGLETKSVGFHMGRDKNSLALMADRYDVFGNAYTTAVSTMHPLFGSRHNNLTAVRISPSENVKAEVQYILGESTTTNDIYSGNVEFKLGGLTTALGTYNAQDGRNRATMVAASYALNSSTKVNVIASDGKVAGVDQTGKSVALSQKVSAAGTVISDYGDVDGANSYGVGYTHNLSKRTNLRVRYRNVDSDTNSSDLKVLAFGIEHNF